MAEIKATINKNEINANIKKQSIIARLTGSLRMANPSGNDKEIQFNDNGVFSGFGSYDKEKNELTITSLKLTGEIEEEGQAITLKYFNENKGVVTQNLNEDLIGTINGTNKVFLTEKKYKERSTRIYLNGQRLKLLDDYTESGDKEITFTEPPESGDKIIIDYS